jgi:hypothetical protein
MRAHHFQVFPKYIWHHLMNFYIINILQLFICQGDAMKFKYPLKAFAIATLMASLPLSTAYALKYHGPIVVSDSFVHANGSIISGNYAGTISQPAISVTTSAPVTIINSTVTGPGDLIYATNANLTVLETTGVSTNPNILNVQKGMFVHVENAINVDVENCSAQGMRFGVYINRYVGNYTHLQTVKILNNNFTNTDGRPSNGNGGYVTSGSFNAHAIQLNTVLNVPNMEIAWNNIVNQPYQSQVNDNINIYSSSGIPASHLLVHDNYVQGAYPVRPGIDSYSGGGIISDGNANNTAATSSAYIDMYNNQVVSTSNHGMAIAAGHDISIYNNRIVSSGYLSDGTFSSEKNAVGIYNWNCYNQPVTVFFNNNAHDNLVGLISLSSSGAPFRNDLYLPGQNFQQENNVSWTPNDSAHPAITDEANEAVIWSKKFTLTNKIIGVHL